MRKIQNIYLITLDLSGEYDTPTTQYQHRKIELKARLCGDGFWRYQHPGTNIFKLEPYSDPIKKAS
jgi:hypothetical protein